MTIEDYIQLRDQLKAIRCKGFSGGENCRLCNQVAKTIRESGLHPDEKNEILKAVYKTANPSGWHYGCSGTTTAIEMLETVIAGNNVEVRA